MPHAAAAEQALLGALLLENDVRYRLPSDFSPADFYSTQHRLIFDAVTRVLDSGEAADAVTVHNALVAAGQHEDAGGLTYLNSLAVNTPSAANAANYARVICENAQLRRIIRAAEESLEIAWEAGSRTAAERIEAIEARVREVGEGEGAAQDFLDARELVDAGMSWVLDAHEGRRTGISTGLVDLDRLLGVGLEPGLFVLGGRPSTGKTALALNIALAVVKQGKSVGVYSMEMSVKQIAGRLLAGEAKINHSLLRRGELHDSDFGPLATAGERIAALPLFISQKPSPTIDQLSIRARKLARRSGGLGLLVVDYLQLMSLPKAETATLALGEVTRKLKQLSAELAAPVLLLSQLNREVDKRTSKRPVLSDLRQSGSIEQDADVVVLVHREDPGENPAQDGAAELIVAKNRDGEVGVVNVKFFGQFQRFENFAR